MICFDAWTTAGSRNGRGGADVSLMLMPLMLPLPLLLLQ
jgi:hypothetical protein